MTRLIVCRHADPASEDAAGVLARSLQRLPIAAVYTSPLERALRTARSIAEEHGLAEVVVDDLREIDRGEVEGLGFDDYAPELKESLLQAPSAVTFPGGESYADLRARVTAAVATIVAAHADSTVAVVAHAGPIRALLGNWLAMEDGAVFRLDQRYGAVNVVDLVDGIPFVRLVNGTRVDG